MTADQVTVDHLGLVRLEVGDVVALDRGLHIVDMVNDSRARCVPMQGYIREIANPDGTRCGFECDAVVSITTRLEPSILVERRGRAGLKEFVETAILAQKQGKRNSMKRARKARESKKSESSSEQPAAKPRKGKPTPAEAPHRLGEIMGHSVCSVIKRLGKEGATAEQARAIMTALKVPAKPTTVQLNVSAGRNGKGTAAGLTADQVKELMALAPA